MAYRQTIQFLGLDVNLPSTMRLGQRIATQRSIGRKVWRTVYEGRSWEYGFALFTTDRRLAQRFALRYNDILGGSTGVFSMPAKQVVALGNVTGNVLANAKTAGTTAITHNRNIAIPTERKIRFAGHTQVYAVRASAARNLVITPPLHADIGQDEQILVTDAQVVFQGLDPRGQPLSVDTPNETDEYVFDIQLTEDV